MTPDEEALAIAARIADGSGIDWRTADATLAGATTRGVLNQLKAISSLADLHREWAAAPGGDAAPALTQWGPLTLIGAIGEGQFGRVYRAWDPRLQRQVALKLLHTTSPELAAAPTRAIEEARMLAQVRHPNVLTVHGAESIDGQVGIWTEFIDGCTLESLLAGHSPLPAADVIAIGIDLSRALAAVHEAGLLHRDVKAQNVMRETGGRIVLMDFGTGHDVVRAPTREGDLSGTPLYLAPELFAGNSPSVATDVYALAVLLFYLSTGRYPVPGRTLDDVRTGHQGRRPVHVGDVRSELPRELAGVIERGLAVDSRARYEGARAFEAALENVRSTPNDARSTATSWWRSHRVAAMLTLFIIAVALGGVFALGGIGRPNHAEPALVKIAGPAARLVTPPSRDGRILPYIDDNNDVAIWEVKTGRSVHVTNAGLSGDAGVSPYLSPNGDRVVYGWAVAGQGHELRISPVDRSWPPQVILPHQTAYTPIPADWSRDGREILCWLSQKNGTFDLVLVPVERGRIRPLYKANTLSRAQFSPDGKFVVVRHIAAEPALSDLLILDAGSDLPPPRVLVAGPGEPRSHSWTADGRGLFFVRDSQTISGSTDGWTIRVVKGVPQGQADLVAEDLGNLRAENETQLTAALTDDGSIFRMFLRFSTEVYTAPVDWAGTSTPGPPTRISETEIGGHLAPAWSPDGRFIAYYTQRTSDTPGVAAQRTLTIKTLSSGAAEERPLPLPFLGGYPPRWTHDSASVAVWGGTTRARARFFRVDIDTGEMNPVAVDGQILEPPMFQYSPDGRDLLYIDGSGGIVARDLKTGDERTVVSHGGPFVIAPDGHAIAFNRQVGAQWMLEVMTFNGARRVLAPLGDWLKIHSWTPDSQDVLYERTIDDDWGRLWRVPSDGGEARDLHYRVRSSVNPISVSPDGRQIAYPERTPLTELWITPSVLGPRQAGSGRSKQ